MDGMAGALLARLRLVLAVTLAAGGAGVFATASLLATSTSPSIVMVAAAAATVAALVVTSRLSVTPLSSPLALPVRRAGDVPAPRSGRVTDSPHHPLLPRAPGPV